MSSSLPLKKIKDKKITQKVMLKIPNTFIFPYGGIIYRASISLILYVFCAIVTYAKSCHVSRELSPSTPKMDKEMRCEGACEVRDPSP